MKFQQALVMNVPYGTVLSLEGHLEGLQHDVCFSTSIGDVIREDVYHIANLVQQFSFVSVRCFPVESS